MSPRAKPVTMRYAGLSDVGQVREHNEDAFLVGASVLAVADGMGGHAAGEVAARIAVETIARVVRPKPRHDPAGQLTAAIREANQIIVERAADYEQFAGMGTTVTAAVIQGSDVVIAQVGDSRAYLLRDGELDQLTEDHSLVQELVREGRLTQEEAAVHPQRSVITRALGTSGNVEVDIVRRVLVAGDKLLLCSDGLTAVMSGDAIARTLGGDTPPAELCSRLIAQANVRGGPDNITVVVVHYLGHREEEAPKRKRHGARGILVPVIGVTLAFVLVAGLVAWIGSAYLSTNYYVAFSGDRVAIFRGVPDEVMGIRFARVYRLTAIKRDELPGYYQERLAQGIPMTGAGDADEVIRQIILARQPQTP